MTFVDALASASLVGVTLDWEDLLNQSRNHLHQQSSVDGPLCQYIPNIAEVISHYIQALYHIQSISSSHHDVEVTTSDDVLDIDQYADTLKPLISQTRRALRFGISLFKDESSRKDVQEEAVVKHRLHMVLPSLISNRNVDAKCRTLASRYICNLGTSNSITAFSLMKDIKASDSNSKQYSWGGMIYISGVSCNRESLGAVSAAIYNCLSALEPTQSSDNLEEVCRVASNLASDKILMCNIIRFIIPSDAIHEMKIDDDCDEATDWIARLIEKLCSVGMLPQIYSSLGVVSGTSITPEQVVLLHCIRSALEESSRKTNGNEEFGHEINPLGGSVGFKTMRATMVFVAELWIGIERAEEASLSKDKAEWYEGESLCVADASMVLLDILATSFMILDESFSEVRKVIEKETNLLRHVVLKYAKIVDRLAQENQGRKARELKISEQDQCILTSLVRIIGNMCYRCTWNQDMMRDIKVPFPQNLSPSDATIRNGLHILLTSTSLAHGCFTLREWAIIAIRNSLEGNIINQSIVEELQTMKAVQTPELQRLGVDVQIDEKGKVRVHDARSKDESEN